MQFTHSCVTGLSHGAALAGVAIATENGTTSTAAAFIATALIASLLPLSPPQAPQ
jgi:hypothetical protein